MTVRIRLGAVALAFAGVMFLLYPAIRPWHDESTVAGARLSMASDAWVAAHFFGMLGFIAMPLGLLALHKLVDSTASFVALICAWIGAGLTLPYYGAEDFGLHALARSATPNLLDVVDSVRYQPVAITIFGLGLLLLAVAGVLVAVAIRRRQAAAGVLFAIGFVLFIPQFYLPAPARIAHGALVAIGCAWLAVPVWRSARQVHPAGSAPRAVDRLTGPLPPFTAPGSPDGRRASAGGSRRPSSGGRRASAARRR